MMRYKFQDQTFSRNEITGLPHEPGVYSFYDQNGCLLYIGKAIDLSKRISSYFHKNSHDSKTEALVSQIENIKIINVQSEYEALLLEAKLINFYKPKYNIIWKDDKHYIYIKITREKFPRILLARKSDDMTSRFYGPFPSSQIVRDILRYVRSIIPYCNQNRSAKKRCFYSHIGLCDPCPCGINPKKEGSDTVRVKYMSNIRKIRHLLEGNYSILEKRLRADMTSLSKNCQFEKAALIRDRLRRLVNLLQEYHPPVNYMTDPYFASKTAVEEISELATLLNQESLNVKSLERIECYDISNLSGKLATGSMVVFINGRPAKQFYRRFRIKLKTTPDDFAMLSEVLDRRLRHKEWDFPGLFIIDGGKPQLMALERVFRAKSMKIPFIGIAKMYDELVLPKSYKKIRLPHSSAPLHVVQRIRDEAHRFAHSYHEKLRLKSVLGETVDS